VPPALNPIEFTLRLLWVIAMIAGVALTAPISLPLLSWWVKRQERHQQDWISSQACPACGHGFTRSDIRLARETAQGRLGAIKRLHPGSKVTVKTANVICSGCQTPWHA
jgi:hypothetical protein